ncbi:MAG: hypothetical protein ABSD29_15950 [Verrucomicrobiota bacterium]
MRSILTAIRWLAATNGYACVITNSTECSVTSTLAALTVNPLPAVSVNSATICAGGSATLTATNNASSPTYLWNDPLNSTTASITVSPAATTVYSVTVTDGTTGCANSGTGTVTVNSAPTAAAGSAQTVCPGGSGVTIGGSPTATGGTGPYTYSWSPGTDLDNPAAANPTATVTSTTTYTVMVTDHNGCTANASVIVTVIPQPEITSITLLGTDATLVWSSLSGQTYRVQYTTDLVDYPPGSTWTELTGPASDPLLPDVTATGATATFTDTSGAAPQRFYRISVVCP